MAPYQIDDIRQKLMKGNSDLGGNHIVVVPNVFSSTTLADVCAEWESNKGLFGPERTDQRTSFHRSFLSRGETAPQDYAPHTLFPKTMAMLDYFDKEFYIPIIEKTEGITSYMECLWYNEGSEVRSHRDSKKSVYLVGIIVLDKIVKMFTGDSSDLGWPEPNIAVPYKLGDVSLLLGYFPGQEDLRAWHRLERTPDRKVAVARKGIF